MKRIIMVSLLVGLFLSSVIAGRRETLRKEIPLGNEEQVRVNMDLKLAKIIISPGSSRMLFTAVVEYDPDKFRPIIDYTEGETGYLDIESRKRGDFDLKSLSDEVNDWEMTFSDQVPLEIDLDLGLGEGRLDFSGLKINDLNVDAGLSKLEIRFDKPNRERLGRLKIDSGLGEFTAKGLLNANCDEIDFSGGLGSSEIYFTGECGHPVEAAVEVGLGSIKIYIQEGTPTKIYISDSIFSSLRIKGFQKARKGVYLSRNWDDSARNKLEIEVEVGMGSVSVEWID